jgi:hypothetical protein
MSRTDPFIDVLFPGNPLLCVGDQTVISTQTRERPFEATCISTRSLFPRQCAHRRERQNKGNCPTTAKRIPAPVVVSGQLGVSVMRTSKIPSIINWQSGT